MGTIRLSQCFRIPTPLTTKPCFAAAGAGLTRLPRPRGEPAPGPTPGTRLSHQWGPAGRGESSVLRLVPGLRRSPGLWPSAEARPHRGLCCVPHQHTQGFQSQSGPSRGGEVAWDQEHSRVEAAPPRAHRAILRLLKTTGHVMPRAALHIGRWSPCSPVRGDSPLLVCGAVPPADSPDAGSFSKQAGQHLALGIHRGLQGPVNLLLRWFRFRGQRAGGVLCRGPLPRRGRAGLRGVCVGPRQSVRHGPRAPTALGEAPLAPACQGWGHAGRGLHRPDVL